ncbi:MAG TPA: universal stress protein [Thermoleophilia bacterium]|nr:universal stress protein [Thermoleophilia bacterium]
MTLLIAVADAAADRELVASARALADVARWEVRAVHVREPGVPEPASAELEDLDVTAVDGDPIEALLRLERGTGVDAVAFGLRCPCGPACAPGIGHVAEALLNGHVAPVLLVRPGMRPITGLKRLYVPLEGSPSTSAAMRAADDALCGRGREIVMLHVATGATPAETGSLPVPRIMDQAHYEWAAWQDEFTMRFSQCPEGGRHRVAVRVGDPAGIIAREADASGAELIVLSWSGSFESGHGAVIKDLLDTAPCPLLLVPSALAAA